MEFELGLVVAHDERTTTVRPLGRDETVAAVPSDTMTARGLLARPGDLVRLERGEPPRIVYRWERGRVAAVANGTVTVARAHRAGAAPVWFLGRLGPAPDPGAIVFTDVRNERAVIVDTAGPDGGPRHPDRFGERYRELRDELAELTFWLRPRPPGRLHEDGIDVDEATVRRLLRAQFPRWAGLPLRRLASTGTVHAIFRLGDRLAVRLPMAVRFDGDTDGRWLDLVAPHVPVGVPRVRAAGEPDDGYPCRWTVVDWLPGRPWPRDDAEVGLRGAAALAEVIRRLQRVRPADVPFDPRVEAGRPGGVMRHVRLAAEAARPWVDTDAVLAVWDRAREVPAWTGEPRLVHGDLLAGNVLADGHGLSAVIDWGNAHFGDPADDLVAAWNLFTGPARRAFVAAAGFDHATWVRAHALVLTRVTNVPYYAETNPAFAADAVRTVAEALADHPDSW